MGDYRRDLLLECWQWCDAAVDDAVDALDLAAPECGFPWYSMSKLEHQLVNLRHIQHHAAVLGDRVRQATGTGIGWVGAGASKA